MGRREHARLPGLVGRERAGHGTGLAGEDLEVVVEQQGLGAAGRLRSWQATTVPPSVTSIAAPRIRAVRVRPAYRGRDGVAGLPDADPGLGVDLDRCHPGGVEGLRGQQAQGGPVGLAILADRQAAAADMAREVAPVGLLELAVELGEAPHPRHRHEEVPAGAAHLALDAALLVGTPLTRDAEEAVEAIVGTERDEALGLGPVPSPQDPGHEGPGVVVADPCRHPAEPREGDDVALEERLLALAAIGDVDGHARMGEAQLEDRDWVRSPSMDTSARPKSTWASSPGRWWPTMVTSRCSRWSSRRTSRT